MLNGLDLFSGYGGISLALREYVRPVMYCEIERYAQAILLSRMDDEAIPFAPIWNDVTTINGSLFKGLVDIVYGGFPCQDISCAGKGAGLEGKRSGLFYEVLRICKEASPQFIFLENVPAIRTRGSIEVQEALASIGYDCRWGVISASEVGANHKRERWFCLAKNSNSRGLEEYGMLESVVLNRSSKTFSSDKQKEATNERALYSLANSYGLRELSKQRKHDWACDESWWQVEPDVGRVVDGATFRSHRIKALGNGVVPLQVKIAFERLIGITV